MPRLADLTINALCLCGLGIAGSTPAQQAQPVAAQPVTAGQEPAQTMGAVATRDALVQGGLQVEGEFAELVSNVSVTAYDRTAAITLSRGGHVLVCATSQFHLLHSGSGPSLLFGLDRGAMEIYSPSATQDVILTPDIRFTVQTPGSFDLDLRVTPDGDTCVDNAGAGAPVLSLDESFSSATYRLLPGQHVLFEHGSLREVVDNERFSCGCPAATPPVTESAAKTEAHPFPEAASEGLAPVTPPANSAPAGEKHTQIAATLSYAEGQPPPPSTLPSPAGASKARPPGQPAGNATGNSPSAVPPAAPPGAHDIVHSIGHFFHRLFHPEKKSAAPAS